MSQETFVATLSDLIIRFGPASAPVRRLILANREDATLRQLGFALVRVAKASVRRSTYSFTAGM